MKPKRRIAKTRKTASNAQKGDKPRTERPFSSASKPSKPPRKFKSSSRFKKSDSSSRTEKRPAYDFKKMEKIRQKKGPEDPRVRLNKYIADAGVCSRREADKLIQEGLIKVNGEVVTTMGYKVEPNDVVHYGKRKLSRQKYVYVLLNKPKDTITTTDDPEGRKTVLDLVSAAAQERIYPVGRLDRDTTGLLLLTNDGELSQKLAHPSFEIPKIYQVDLDRPLTREDYEQLVQGLTLEDGVAQLDEIFLLNKEKTSVGLKIHLGRNRIIRRIFETLGYQVYKLDRTMYAELTKKDLKRGRWRYLTEKEVIRLKYFL